MSFQGFEWNEVTRVADVVIPNLECGEGGHFLGARIEMVQSMDGILDGQKGSSNSTGIETSISDNFGIGTTGVES